jgi:hypothetical protein
MLTPKRKLKKSFKEFKEQYESFIIGLVELHEIYPNRINWKSIANNAMNKNSLGRSIKYDLIFRNDRFIIKNVEDDIDEFVFKVSNNDEYNINILNQVLSQLNPFTNFFKDDDERYELEFKEITKCIPDINILGVIDSKRKKLKKAFGDIVDILFHFLNNEFEVIKINENEYLTTDSNLNDQYIIIMDKDYNNKKELTSQEDLKELYRLLYTSITILEENHPMKLKRYIMEKRLNSKKEGI